MLARSLSKQLFRPAAAAAFRAPLLRQFHATPPALVAVGDKIPSIELDHGFAEMVKVPEYLEQQGALKDAGVDEVIVYCVNDGAVMMGWEKDQGVKRGSSGQFFYKGKPSMVTFMADTRSELTQALDMVLDDEGVMGALGNPRCKRFALMIDDGTVTAVNVSEAPGDPAGDADPEGPITALTRVETMIKLA